MDPAGITRAMADQARTIRIPVHMDVVINKLGRIRRTLLEDLGREPAPEELAKEMDITPGTVLELQHYARAPLSLDQLIGEEGDFPLADFIEDSQAVVAADVVCFALLQDQLQSVLATLSERDAGIIRLRFGLTDGLPRTSRAPTRSATNGQVIDVLISQKRDLAATRRFFIRALEHGRCPTEVTTDRAPAYPRVIDDLIPAACHVTEQYANNPVEADHGLLQARLRPTRGLKRLRSARVISAGHAVVQNLRRDHYELGVDIDPWHRLTAIFTDLARAI